jgi:uncharacterized protein YecT (DUF1311 family)
MRTLIYSAPALLLAVSEALAGASFDCSKAASPVEILICGDAALSEADNRMAQAYQKAMQAESTPSLLRSEQRIWLKVRARQCQLPERGTLPPNVDARVATACLVRLYQARQAALDVLLRRLPLAGERPGQTEPAQETDDIPPDLLATLRTDLLTEDPSMHCSQQQFERDVAVSDFDLTVCDVFQSRAPLPGYDATTKRLSSSVKRRQPAALLVEGQGPCAGGGNDNWDHLLYIRAGNGWRQIFDDSCQDVFRRCTSTHGLPDLETWHHASASEGDKVVYHFDGNAYKEIASCHVQDEDADRVPCP